MQGCIFCVVGLRDVPEPAALETIFYMSARSMQLGVLDSLEVAKESDQQRCFLCKANTKVPHFFGKMAGNNNGHQRQ